MLSLSNLASLGKKAAAIGSAVALIEQLEEHTDELAAVKTAALAVLVPAKANDWTGTAKAVDALVESIIPLVALLEPKVKTALGLPTSAAA